MILTTGEEIPNGKIVEVLGIVTGNVVQSKNIFRNIFAGLKSIVGGEIHVYTELQSEARAIANKRMVAEAEKMGANGIICCRYSASMIMQGMSEILVYGTAVKLG